MIAGIELRDLRELCGSVREFLRAVVAEAKQRASLNALRVGSQCCPERADGGGEIALLEVSQAQIQLQAG